MKGAGEVKLVVFMDAPARDHGLDVPVLGWEEALRIGRESSPVDHTDRLSAYDLACFIYTSGTGGRPKGVMISEGNLFAMTSKLPGIFLLHDTSSYLALLPMFHISGGGTPVSVLCAGAKVVLSSGTSSSAILHDLTTHRITHVNLVPSLISLLLADPATDEYWHNVLHSWSQLAERSNEPVYAEELTVLCRQLETTALEASRQHRPSVIRRCLTILQSAYSHDEIDRLQRRAHRLGQRVQLQRHLGARLGVPAVGRLAKPRYNIVKACVP